MTTEQASRGTVRCTEQEAQANLLAVLQLCAAGKLRCSQKTHRPAAATVAAVAAILQDGDFYPADPIAAFAWSLLLQAGGLAELASGKLALTTRGRAALTKPPHDTLRHLWQWWLNRAVLDEFSRIEEIKGQRAAAVLSAAGPRRKAVGQALAACVPGQWTQVDDLFAAMRGSRLDFTIARSDRALWKLYLQDPQYGSLGYDGFHDWSLLQGRYTLAVLFEYVATLGLIDIEYVPPVGAREDYRDNWGGDDLDQLSRYDGLLALRLNPLGAYATGRAPAYIPAPTPVDTDCCGIKVLPNFDIVALDGLRPADALFLDAFADTISDRVWTLSVASLLSALDTKRTLKELRCYLAQASSQPLPQTVATLLDDIERRLGSVRDTGPVHLIECADEALATLLAGDRRLRALCARLGERQLAVPAEKLPAFRKALLAQGYPLA